MTDLGPKFFTLEMMADALGVSKSFVSRRARSGKDVRGRPVDRWAVDEDLRPWSEEGGKKLGGFRVPRSALGEDGTPRQLERSGRSRIRAKIEQQREEQEGGPAPEDPEGEDPEGTEPSGEPAPPSQGDSRSGQGADDARTGRTSNQDRRGDPEKEEPEEEEPEKPSSTSQYVTAGLAVLGSQMIHHS